jgi:hypothetical protein
MCEQTRIIGLSRRVVIHAETASKAGRDQRGLEAMFEREVHAEIGTQAQRRKDLSGADS